MGWGDIPTTLSCSLMWIGLSCFISLSVYVRDNEQLIRPSTHVISAILNVGQDVEEDWPLFVKVKHLFVWLNDLAAKPLFIWKMIKRIVSISLSLKDHDGEDHSIMMSPGDIIWYESASVIHGRPYPLRGRSYDNVFAHFKPRGNSWYGWVMMKVK